jgi:hypothetical protein
VATKTKVDIVQHKSSLQAMREPEWDKKRPHCHTADEHSDSIKAVRSKTRNDDAPQIDKL